MHEKKCVCTRKRLPQNSLRGATGLRLCSCPFWWSFKKPFFANSNQIGRKGVLKRMAGDQAGICQVPVGTKGECCAHLDGLPDVNPFKAMQWTLMVVTSGSLSKWRYYPCTWSGSSYWGPLPIMGSGLEMPPEMLFLGKRECLGAALEGVLEGRGREKSYSLGRNPSSCGKGMLDPSPYM